MRAQPGTASSRATIENVAHRGASLHAPENTLAAFDLALVRGADRIELDVQLSRDGRVVVSHDQTLARTTDAARRFPDREPWDLRAFSWEELRRVEVAAPANGAGVASLATLDDALEALAGRTTLLLELKDPGRHPGLVEAVAEVLVTHDWWLDPAAADRVVVQSFDPSAVERIRPLLPDHVSGAWLVADRTHPDVDAVPGWATMVVVDESVVTPGVVADVHAAGRRLHAYTVNDPGRMRELCDTGLDGIITDDPAALARVVADRGPRPR